MNIRGLHHVQVTIPPGEERAGRAFYCDVLGLPEIPKPKVLQSRGGFWVQLGAIDLHIGIEDNFDRASRRNHIALEVEDIDGWRTHLTQHGIDLIDRAPIPGWRRAKLRDPFGNMIELMQRSE